MFSDFSIDFKHYEDRYTKELILSYKKDGNTKEISTGEYDEYDVGSFTLDELCEFFEITEEASKQHLRGWFQDFFNNLSPITGNDMYNNVIHLVNWYGYFVVMDVGYDCEKPSIFYLIDSELLMSLLNNDMKRVLRAFREVLKEQGIDNE